MLVCNSSSHHSLNKTAFSLYANTFFWVYAVHPFILCHVYISPSPSRITVHIEDTAISLLFSSLFTITSASHFFLSLPFSPQKPTFSPDKLLLSLHLVSAFFLLHRISLHLTKCCHKICSWPNQTGYIFIFSTNCGLKMFNFKARLKKDSFSLHLSNEIFLADAKITAFLFGVKHKSDMFLTGYMTFTLLFPKQSHRRVRMFSSQCFNQSHLSLSVSVLRALPA